MTTKPNAKTTALPPRYAQVHKMLSAANGATISEIAAACGWMNHSTRAMISTGRSRYGWKVEKDNDEDRGTVYRLIAAKTPKATKAKASASKPKAKVAAKPKTEPVAPTVEVEAQPTA